MARKEQKQRSLLSTLVRTIFYVIALSFVAKKFFSNINLVLKVADFFDSFDVNVTELNANNMFLQGHLAPVEKENHNIVMKVISGEIPSDLSGLFLRIGPNPITGHLTKRYHWFDGNGMIHSVRIKDGKALYSNQWIETFRYLTERSHNRPIFFNFGELIGYLGLIKAIIIDPMILSCLSKRKEEVGQANTALTYFNGRLYAGHEGK